MRRLFSLPSAFVAVALVAAAGCSEGQPVDAGGERGGGGLAFVLMTLFLVLFMASLFYMDHVRKRRERDRD
ncbi:MAG TPA: hypothetical protein VFF40_10485 [Acidimicrobiia bacterium]|nr:hypothetical protein [Acidimicrobiia bacterium]